MPLKLYKRNGKYHYRGTVPGIGRLRGSTGTTVRDVAEKILLGIEAQAWKSRVDGPTSTLTFSQAVINYKAASKPTRFLKRILAYWKDTLVKDIKPGMIQQSALVLYPKASGATRNRQVIVPTCAVINHSAKSELCARIRVERFKVETKSKVPATLEWVQAFMANASPHLGALALFMFLTGARISEALAVQWGDINFVTRSVLIKQTKLGNERRAHLPQALIVALANIQRTQMGYDGQAHAGRSPFFYRNRIDVLKIWLRTTQRAGIAPLSFHSCRHGFATALLRAGIDVVTIARLGGWKSVRHVLQTYGHANDDATLTDRIAGTILTQPTSGNSNKPYKTGTS